MSKAVIAFGAGSILVGAFLSVYVNKPLPALLCGLVDIALIAYGIMANDEDKKDDLFFGSLGATQRSQALEEVRQKQPEDQSSWPDVILECQWPSLVHESRIPGSHIVRKRPWMLRYQGPGAVYNVVSTT